VVPDVPPRPARPGITCSVTAVARYRRCPLQYRYAHVDRVPPRVDPVRAVGTAAHSALEAVLAPDAPPPDGDALVRRFAGELRRHRVEATVQGRHALALARERFPALVARTVRGGARIAAVERAFTLAVGPHRVHGRIDRVDRHGGGFVLVDYKTGAPPPPGPAEEEGRLVLRTYLAGAREAWGVVATGATLEYVFDGAVKTDSPDGAEVAMAIEEVRGTLDDISAGRHEPRPGWVCRSCDFALLCPARDR
jgi:CRISPR/Cas system-associated exonuclease Cas4 (RecB family)